MRPRHPNKLTAASKKNAMASGRRAAASSGKASDGEIRGEEPTERGRRRQTAAWLATGQKGAQAGWRAKRRQSLSHRSRRPRSLAGTGLADGAAAGAGDGAPDGTDAAAAAAAAATPPPDAGLCSRGLCIAVSRRAWPFRRPCGSCTPDAIPRVPLAQR